MKMSQNKRKQKATKCRKITPNKRIQNKRKQTKKKIGKMEREDLTANWIKGEAKFFKTQKAQQKSSKTAEAFLRCNSFAPYTMSHTDTPKDIVLYLG